VSTHHHNLSVDTNDIVRRPWHIQVGQSLNVHLDHRAKRFVTTVASHCSQDDDEATQDECQPSVHIAKVRLLLKRVDILPYY
jgi:hypothetical protein